MRIIFPTHFIFLVVTTQKYYWGGGDTQLMKLLFKRFSLASSYLHPFVLNIFVSRLFSNTLSLCYSLNVGGSFTPK